MRKKENAAASRSAFLQTAALFDCALSSFSNRERIEQRETRFGERSWSVIDVNPGAHQIDAFDSDPLSLPVRERCIPRQNQTLQLTQIAL